MQTPSSGTFSLKTAQRRTLLTQGLALIAATQLPVSARADAWPTRPLKIVVPNGAGGAADLTARVVAQALTAVLGQSVIVENRPGAGGVVAGELVARAAPDGYTLLLVSSGTAVSAALFKRLPFDTQKDFAPVSTMANFDLALVVPQGSRFKNVGELLSYARANPGKLNLGTPNIGTTQHLAAALLRIRSGVDVQIIPYNGTPAVLTALRSGALDAALDIVGPLMAQIGAQQLQALAVLGAQRSVQLPQTPTLAEQGGNLQGFNVTSWNGLALPAATPPAIVAQLNQALQTVLAQADVKKKLLDLNMNAHGCSSAQLAELLASETRRWAEVIQKAGIPRQ